MPVRAEQPGTLTEWQLRQLPGCKPFVYVGTSVAGEGEPVFTPAGVNRGLRNVEGKLFSVCGNKLYQISNSGVAIPRGTIPGVGRVSMAHNANGLGNELLVVNGYAGYVWNTQTQAFAKVTDTGYPGAFIADFVDQYLAQVEPGGRYWFHSDLADAHSYNTLDQYVAEGDPDRIVSLIVSHREVLVLGKKTIEPYVNTGGATGTFERASNTVIEVGCSARYSVKRMDGSPFWLDDQRLIRRLDGYTPVILSTDPVAQAFAECTEAEIAQAYAFTWEPAGHKVYYITVPGRFTFGFDAKTGQWHRRKTYGLNHWAVVDVVSWNGKWIAADSRSSKLYELDDKYPLDECEPLERELTAPTIWADQNPITLDSVELMLDAAGQSVECVEFPDQPVGPLVSGDAPDGDVVNAYAGYTYTVTPGDSPIAKVEIASGALPDGLTFTESTANIPIAFTPVAGTYDFTVRATDANGLYYNHDDSITIAGAWYWIEDFGNALYDVAGDDEGHFIACGFLSSTGELWETDLEAESFTAIPDLPADTGQWRSIAWGKVDGTGYWVVAYGQYVLWSTDRVTWTRRTAANADAYLHTLYTGIGFVRLGFSGACDRATDPSGSWTTENIGVAQEVRAAVADLSQPGTVVAFGASGGIRRTTDNGNNWAGVSLSVSDPYPTTGFATKGAYIRDGRIVAYKYINATTVAVYSSTDHGATFDISVETVASGSYNGGPAHPVGTWVAGPVEGVLSPNYVQMWRSEDGDPPFTPDLLVEDAPTTSNSEIRAICDTGLGTAIALGLYNDGTSFAYRYRYTV